MESGGVELLVGVWIYGLIFLFGAGRVPPLRRYPPSYSWGFGMALVGTWGAVLVRGLEPAARGAVASDPASELRATAQGFGLVLTALGACELLRALFFPPAPKRSAVQLTRPAARRSDRLAPHLALIWAVGLALLWGLRERAR